MRYQIDRKMTPIDSMSMKYRVTVILTITITKSNFRISIHFSSSDLVTLPPLEFVKLCSNEDKLQCG